MFRKRATNYRAVLRKMICKDKASYGSSPSGRRQRGSYKLYIISTTVILCINWIDWFWFPIFRSNWDVRDDHQLCVLSPGTIKSMIEQSQSRLNFISAQSWYKVPRTYELVNPTFKTSLWRADCKSWLRGWLNNKGANFKIREQFWCKLLISLGSASPYSKVHEQD